MFQDDAAQGHVQFPQGGLTTFGCELALPDDNHIPSRGLEQRHVVLITLAVAADLLLPKACIGHRLMLLAIVPVPETPVNKDGCPPLAHYDVGPPWQRLHV